MLTCSEFLQEMTDFLDESVDAELKERIQLHIKQCPNCFVILDTTKRTIQVYRGLEAQTIPEDVHSRLMAALDRKIAANKARGSSGAQA